MRAAGLSAALLVALAGCGDDVPVDDAEGADETGGSDGADELPPLPEGHARVAHSFGNYTLAPLEEIQPCIQWTVDNEEPIYVNGVTIVNNGGYHHSNWFVVPETFAPGEDGFFDCGERGFTELEAALAGSVLTAQSTQSRFEEMKLPDGVVVKIPPKHKIVAGGHLLNLAAADYDTELRMTLEIVHPKEVEVVVAPFRLTYYDLEIPAFTEARFTGECDFNSLYESQSGTPLDLELYYVLPHYHYLGNYFNLEVMGGPNDGQEIFSIGGFNADANGQPVQPAVDMTGATGFRFTCGFDNWRDKSIGWGIGDQEMCVMLGLADSKVLMDGTVTGRTPEGEQDGILMHGGDCGVIGLPKNASQTMPTDDEIDGELYVPPTKPEDEDLRPLPKCSDADAEASPQVAPTLANVRDIVFTASCQFSSCHQGASAIAGLDLMAEDLHGELLGHDLQLTETDMPLVTPGDPERSWLYRSIAECAPGETDEPHMPLNAVELLDSRQVALVRDWIAAGANND